MPLIIWCCFAESKYPYCGPNEEYLKCGTGCPKTCIGLPETSECIDKCEEGCFCKDGFIKVTEGGACIPKDSCSES